MLAIETKGVIKRFGRRSVVEDLDLRVPTGSVFGFLGPNGAGKTTTVRLLLGLLRPDGGTIRILEQDLARYRERALAGVGAFIESASLYEHLSGRANLELTRVLLGLPRSEIERVLDVVDMRPAANQRVRAYSLGMKQRLALARAMLGTPRLLLLDEPTNGLDPDGIVAMRKLIRELPDRIGGTVFVSSHLLTEVEQMAQDVCLLRGGRSVLEGSVRDLLDCGAQWDLGVDRAETGASILSAAGMDATPVGHGIVRLTAVNQGSDQVAHANRLLVEGGIAVCTITPRKISLEDLYRDTLSSRTSECSIGKEKQAA